MNLQCAREKLELTPAQIAAGCQQIVSLHQDTTGKNNGGGKQDMMGVCLNVTVVDGSGKLLSQEMVACPMTECRGHDGKSEAESLAAALDMLSEFKYGPAETTLTLTSTTRSDPDHGGHCSLSRAHDLAVQQPAAVAALKRVRGVLEARADEAGALRVEYDRALADPAALVTASSAAKIKVVVSAQEERPGDDILRKTDFPMSDGAATATKVNVTSADKMNKARAAHSMSADNKTELAMVTILCCGALVCMPSCRCHPPVGCGRRGLAAPAPTVAVGTCTRA